MPAQLQQNQKCSVWKKHEAGYYTVGQFTTIHQHQME